MPRSAAALVVSEDQQNQIEQWLAAMGTPQQVALRCRIVQAAGRGESEAAIAAALQINRKTVRLWRMWQILSGGEHARLTLSDRRAIVEILLDTKKDLPDYWRGDLSRVKAVTSSPR